MAYPIPSPFMEAPHEPQSNLFDNLQPICINNPGGDFRDGEVRGMNAERRMELRLREAEYNE